MKLAILSRNSKLYSTRRLVEAARARGHTVRILDPLRCYMRSNAGDFSMHYKGRPLAGFEADGVVAAVRTALQAHFAFAARSFGQTVSLDEIAAVAQGVRGVEAAHVAQLYRVGQSPGQQARLFAALPQASLTTPPAPADLLTLANAGLEVEVLP